MPMLRLMAWGDASIQDIAVLGRKSSGQYDRYAFYACSIRSGEANNPNHCDVNSFVNNRFMRILFR